ncbi:hypothetical protein F4677DRAFT_447459 [Hypoxylon crocopeplum]|nr:hypothetical protein F4677DRAFT_447459 [Hypoxylon crocopeplum]
MPPRKRDMGSSGSSEEFTSRKKRKVSIHLSEPMVIGEDTEANLTGADPEVLADPDPPGKGRPKLGTMRERFSGTPKPSSPRERLSKIPKPIAKPKPAAKPKSVAKPKSALMPMPAPMPEPVPMPKPPKPVPKAKPIPKARPVPKPKPVPMPKSVPKPWPTNPVPIPAATKGNPDDLLQISKPNGKKRVQLVDPQKVTVWGKLKVVQAEPPKPAKAPRKSPEGLGALGLSIKQWRDLEASQETLPRFLFRGFGPTSGGGIDPRLNTTTGIIPHGFLGGKKPTNIYEIRGLIKMIDGHLYGQTVTTDFSSWAACITVAMRYSRNSHVAVIDRKLLAPHVKIYHVPNLNRAGLCLHSIPYEYLAYGPIDGPAFHCVAYSDIIGAGFSSLSGRSYRNRNFDDGVYRDVDKRVVAAKRLASLFRPANNQCPDMIIALTAAFASLIYAGYGRGEILDKELLRELVTHLRNELKVVKLPPADSKQLALVNQKMYVRRYPQLKQLVLLVASMEENIRSNKSYHE